MSETGDRDSGACWFGRFSTMRPRCPNKGTWGKPDAEGQFIRMTRWCNEHKHADDVLCEEVEA